MAFWDFSLSQGVGAITDVLKARTEAETQQRLAEATIQASTAADTRALSLTAINQGQVQFVVTAIIVGLVAIALIRQRG